MRIRVGENSGLRGGLATGDFGTRGVDAGMKEYTLLGTYQTDLTTIRLPWTITT